MNFLISSDTVLSNLQGISVCKRHNPAAIKCTCSTQQCNTDVLKKITLHEKSWIVFFTQFSCTSILFQFKKKLISLITNITCSSSRHKQMYVKSDIIFLTIQILGNSENICFKWIGAYIFCLSNACGWSFKSNLIFQAILKLCYYSSM